MFRALKHGLEHLAAATCQQPKTAAGHICSDDYSHKFDRVQPIDATVWFHSAGGLEYEGFIGQPLPRTTQGDGVICIDARSVGVKHFPVERCQLDPGKDLLLTAHGKQGPRGKTGERGALGPTGKRGTNGPGGRGGEGGKGEQGGRGGMGGPGGDVLIRLADTDTDAVFLIKTDLEGGPGGKGGYGGKGGKGGYGGSGSKYTSSRIVGYDQGRPVYETITCQHPDGPKGPTGPAGDKGPTGPPGPGGSVAYMVSSPQGWNVKTPDIFCLKASLHEDARNAEGSTPLEPGDKVTLPLTILNTGDMPSPWQPIDIGVQSEGWVVNDGTSQLCQGLLNNGGFATLDVQLELCSDNAGGRRELRDDVKVTLEGMHRRVGKLDPSLGSCKIPVKVQHPLALLTKLPDVLMSERGDSVALSWGVASRASFGMGTGCSRGAFTYVRVGGALAEFVTVATEEKFVQEKDTDSAAHAYSLELSLHAGVTTELAATLTLREDTPFNTDIPITLGVRFQRKSGEWIAPIESRHTLRAARVFCGDGTRSLLIVSHSETVETHVSAIERQGMALGLGPADHWTVTLPGSPSFSEVAALFRGKMIVVTPLSDSRCPEELLPQRAEVFEQILSHGTRYWQPAGQKPFIPTVADHGGLSPVPWPTGADGQTRKHDRRRVKLLGQKRFEPPPSACITVGVWKGFWGTAHAERQSTQDFVSSKAQDVCKRYRSRHCYHRIFLEPGPISQSKPSLGPAKRISEATLFRVHDIEQALCLVGPANGDVNLCDGLPLDEKLKAMHLFLTSNESSLAVRALESACEAAIAEQYALREFKIAGKTKKLRYLDSIIAAMTEAFPRDEDVPQAVSMLLRSVVLRLRGLDSSKGKKSRSDYQSNRATRRVDQRLSAWLLARAPFCRTKKRHWRRFWKTHDGPFPAATKEEGMTSS
jgi:hypothetical protein